MRYILVILALVVKRFIFISEFMDVSYCVTQLSGVVLIPWGGCHKTLIHILPGFLVFGEASSSLIAVVRWSLYQMIFNVMLKFWKIEIICGVWKLLPCISFLFLLQKVVTQGDPQKFSPTVSGWQASLWPMGLKGLQVQPWEGWASARLFGQVIWAPLPDLLPLCSFLLIEVTL